MGEMADYYNNAQENSMDDYWDYVTGQSYISDDEQMPIYSESLSIPLSYDDVLTEIGSMSRVVQTKLNSRSLKPRLNSQAIKNLSKEVPTCNICKVDMQGRDGRFGKFYFCPNGCKDQPTVSDNYWQKVKR